MTASDWPTPFIQTRFLEWRQENRERIFKRLVESERGKAATEENYNSVQDLIRRLSQLDNEVKFILETESFVAVHGVQNRDGDLTLQGGTCGAWWWFNRYVAPVYTRDNPLITPDSFESWWSEEGYYCVAEVEAPWE